MGAKEDREIELERILNSFSNFIRMHILKYNLYKYGIDPDDVAQEIRIKLWKVINNEKNIDHRSSYIKKVIDSTVIDHLRKSKRNEILFSEEIMKVISETRYIYQSPEPTQDERLQEIIVKATNQLIESRRKAVQLFLLNMNLDEIARYYSWSKDKARNLLYRGLADLKRILKEKDIFYDPQE